MSSLERSIPLASIDPHEPPDLSNHVAGLGFPAVWYVPSEPGTTDHLAVRQRFFPREIGDNALLSFVSSWPFRFVRWLLRRWCSRGRS